MNASPNVDLISAHADLDVVYWLANETRDERFIDNIFAELCIRLQRAGFPVKRASLHFLIHHPQWLGARMMWADGMHEAEIARVDYDVWGRSEYIDSPANEIHDGATEVRENLERDPSLGRKHAVYDEMRARRTMQQKLRNGRADTCDRCYSRRTERLSEAGRCFVTISAAPTGLPGCVHRTRRDCG
jgi:adenylate cyclase